MANLKNRTPIRVTSFNKGQFSGVEPSVVPEGGATILENVLIPKFGESPQRKGLTVQGDNPSTLVSKWTFDNSTAVDDKSSNEGTATDVTYVDGKFGKCASFNGNTSSIVVSADTSIDVNSIGSMSISAWVYVDSDGENDVGRIVDKTDDRASPTKGYAFYVQGESSSTVKLHFIVVYDGAANAEIETSTTLSTGAWHRVEAVLEADDSANVYIDGALASYDTDTSGVGSPVDDSAADLYIGNGVNGDAGFDGEIDDVRLYNAPRAAADTDLSKIYGLTRFRVPGTIDRVYRIRSTTLERLDDDFLGWTAIDAGFTTDKTTNFVTGRAVDGTYRLFIFNATENVHSMTTGEAMTDEADTNADPPKGTIAEWHDNRLFVVDSNGDVNYSNVLDGQTFNRAINIFRAKRPVKGLKTFKEKQLVLYLVKGIEVLDTNGAIPLADWSKTVFNDEIEFNSPRTIANAGNDQIFLARDGVRLLSRTQFDKIQVGLISQPIQDVIDDINQDAIDVACAHFIDNRYILAIPTGTNTENDTVVIWDALAAKVAGTLEAGWTVIPSDDWNIAAFTEMEFSDNVVSLVAGDNRALSLVYQAFKGNTDNGKAVTMKIAGIDHTVDRVTDAIWDPLNIVAQTGINTSLTLKGETNRGGFRSIGTLDLTGGAIVLPETLPFTLGGVDRVSQLFRSKGLGRGRTFRLQITHSTYNVRPTLVEYSVYARPLNPRFT